MDKISISVRSLGDSKATMAKALALVNRGIIITVDYSRSLEEMIEAGKYDRENKTIARNNYSLPAELKGSKVSLSTKLFHFKHSVNKEDVIYQMERSGHRPATLAELLALGEIRPRLQKKFPIIALGSALCIENGHYYAPALIFDGEDRRIYLTWIDGAWDSGYRFLGSR